MREGLGVDFLHDDATKTKPMKPKSRIGTILLKEFREIFRERRTIMSVVVGPLIITPALFALMGTVISKQTAKEKTKTYTIGRIGPMPTGATAQILAAAPNVKWEAVTQAQAEARIKNRRMAAAVLLPPQMDAALAAGQAAPVVIVKDEGDMNSQQAAGRLRALFDQAGRQVTAQRLKSSGLPPAYATPFAVTESPLKTGGSSGMLFLSMMLPYILIIGAFSGTIYAAFDQVAGEKERGTLETLLVSPASRRDIVLGKFGAVVLVCLLSSLLTIAGLVLSFGSGLKAFDWLARGGIHLSPISVLAIGLALLPLSVLFAGLLLAVSTFARNQKEAQTMLGPLFTIILIPAALSMVLSLDVAKSVALVPILNASMIIKQALNGSFDPVFIGLAFAASALYAALALAFATRLFQRESVLVKV